MNFLEYGVPVNLLSNAPLRVTMPPFENYEAVVSGVSSEENESETPKASTEFDLY